MNDPSHGLPRELPSAAEPATEIIRRLRAAGFAALLAGGCVRDLLLGLEPEDFDVATAAHPEQIRRMFRRTRHVGAQFGVMLVEQRGRWVEVATFRTEGPYLDGRRPSRIEFADDRADACRRDFTINSMYYDPLENRLIDHVGGRADLEARAIRAVGDPDARFQEDHLRLLRAVRFAARLGFGIEPVTRSAIRTHAARLAAVAPERVRDELFRMWSHATRAAALGWLVELDLLPHILPGREWDAGRFAMILRRLERAASAGARDSARLTDDLWFCLVLALLLEDQSPELVEAHCRRLTCTNDERAATTWLVRHLADLDDPAVVSLAALKRLMAAPGFPALRRLALARHAELADAERRSAALERRLAAIPPEAVQPAPYITGDDLAAQGLLPGPLYKTILDDLYTRQLEEQLDSRSAALSALAEHLRRLNG